MGGEEAVAGARPIRRCVPGRACRARRVEERGRHRQRLHGSSPGWARSCRSRSPRAQCLAGASPARGRSTAQASSSDRDAAGARSALGARRANGAAAARRACLEGRAITELLNEARVATPEERPEHLMGAAGSGFRPADQGEVRTGWRMRRRERRCKQSPAGRAGRRTRSVPFVLPQVMRISWGVGGLWTFATCS